MRSLPVVACAVIGAAVAVFLVRASGVHAAPLTVASWTFATTNWLLTGAVSAHTALAAGRAGTATGRALRRFWLLVGASSVCTGAGAALSGALGSGQNTVPVSAFVLYAVGMGFVVVGLIGLPVPWQRLGSRITVALDLMIISSATLVMLWFIATDILGVPEDPALTSIALTLGVVGGSGLIGIGKIMLTGWEPVDQMSIRLMAGTMVISAMGAGGLAALSPLTGLTPEILVLPCAATGWLIAARRQHSVLGAPVEPTVKARRRPFSIVPYLAVALFDGLTLVAQYRQTPNHDRLVIAAMALTALVIARQFTAFYDNARLVVRLDDTLREVRGQEHRFQTLVRNATDVISITDHTNRTTYISHGVEAMLGVTPEQVMSGDSQTLIHPDDRPEFVERMAAAAAEPGATARAEARFRHADGTWRWLEVNCTNFYDDPDIGGMVSNARDVTESRRYQEELAHQATHDDLTGLVNRTLFARVCDEALAGDEPDRTVMVLVDLDDFKQINDRLGHAVGDALLGDVAARLRDGLRPQDTVARLGGDEFAVLLRDVAPDERMDIARRLMRELEQPVRAAGHDLLVRASVGVAPGVPGVTAAELLRRADLAMYGAKNQGRGRCVEFDHGMDQAAQEHARLAADLSAAIERNELVLVYQPIVTLPHGELSGVEALIRWQHPVRGFVSPAEFIPVAERTGLIVQLGAWILYEACRQGAAWLQELGPAAPGRISVNVSARQLIEPDFPTVVEAALLASGLPAEKLTVEITETAVFGGGPALAAVTAMKNRGVRVALDDFGTGHSSLGLLRTVPIDLLKVDKSFVDGVGQSPEQEAIITSLSHIGSAMRLVVVAEGVETAAQAERLHELGYRYAQGYHFARPLKPADVATFALKPTPV